MITRRRFMQVVSGGALASAMLGTYAVAIEPLYRLAITRYAFTPPNWVNGLSLRIAVLADLHACNPWMSEARIQEIVAQTNALEPDIVLLLGDYVTGMRLVTSIVEASDWASALADLEAPLGIFGVMGNHDWWEDAAAQKNGYGPTFAHKALNDAGIPILENDAIQLNKDGRPFWVAGIGDQIALRPNREFGRNHWQGVDDLPGTLAKITNNAPILLLAHEPDIFPDVPARVSLTLSGHTHGGQVRLLGYSPVVPSRFKNRYAYGHVVERGRHLLVSGGLGCSIAPIRFGIPPEIVLLELGSGGPTS